MLGSPPGFSPNAMFYRRCAKCGRWSHPRSNFQPNRQRILKLPPLDIALALQNQYSPVRAFSRVHTFQLNHRMILQLPKLGIRGITITRVRPEPPFFDQTTFHFRRLGPCKNASKMLRVGLVAGMAATAVMVAAPVKAQTPTAAQPRYDDGSAAPLRSDLPTSNHMPASHHANASSVTPRCGRSAASPPRRHQIRPRNTVSSKPTGAIKFDTPELQTRCKRTVAA